MCRKFYTPSYLQTLGSSAYLYSNALLTAKTTLYKHPNPHRAIQNFSLDYDTSPHLQMPRQPAIPERTAGFARLSLRI